MIYFDNAATSYFKPKSVIDGVMHAIEHGGNAMRGVNAASIKAGMEIFEARNTVSNFFNAPAYANVVWTMNITMSLNTVIKGYLKKGDHVITTVMEHNSVLRPIYQMEKNGVEHTIVGLDKNLPKEYGFINYDDLEKAFKPNTKAVVITNASNLTGNIVDIKKVASIAHGHNAIIIVDSAQTAGSLKIDMTDSCIDILCFTGHKGLLGVQGSGGIVLSKDFDIEPLLSGGTGIKTFEKRQPDAYPEHLEAGTLNRPGILSVYFGIKYIEEYGIDNILNKERDLNKYFNDELKKIDKVKIYGLPSVEQRMGITSIAIDGFSSGEVSDFLNSNYEIMTRSGGHCAPLLHESMGTKENGLTRFSFSHNNTLEEVDVALSAIKELIK